MSIATARLRSIRRPTTVALTVDPLIAAAAWTMAWSASGTEFLAQSISNGAGVTTLPDEVGTQNMSQATSSKQPLWRTSSSSFNNRPVLEFDGVDDFIVTNLFTELTAPRTMVLVGRRRSTNQTTSERFTEGRGDGNVLSSVTFATSAGTWGIHNSATKTYGTVDTNAHLWRIFWGGGSGKWYLDSTDTAQGGNTGSNGLSKLALGANIDGTSLFGDVDIAFVGIKAGGDLTSQEHTNVLAASQSFYGTP